MYNTVRACMSVPTLYRQVCSCTHPARNTLYAAYHAYQHVLCVHSLRARTAYSYDHVKRLDIPRVRKSVHSSSQCPSYSTCESYPIHHPHRYFPAAFLSRITSDRSTNTQTDAHQLSHQHHQVDISISSSISLLPFSCMEISEKYLKSLLR